MKSQSSQTGNSIMEQESEETKDKTENEPEAIPKKDESGDETRLSQQTNSVNINNQSTEEQGPLDDKKNMRLVQTVSGFKLLKTYPLRR